MLDKLNQLTEGHGALKPGHGHFVLFRRFGLPLS
jgi:hypothetical protein